jgi:hypothetical protein
MDSDRLNRWLTLIANLAVVAGIVFLAFELQQTTRIQEHQMRMDLNSDYFGPFFSSSELVEVWSKVKAVDGLEPVTEVFVDRYKLTPGEAAIWSRHVHSIWYTQQAQFEYGGPSDALSKSIGGLYRYPDTRVVFEMNEDGELSDEFIAYVESIVSND